MAVSRQLLSLSAAAAAELSRSAAEVNSHDLAATHRAGFGRVRRPSRCNDLLYARDNPTRPGRAGGRRSGRRGGVWGGSPLPGARAVALSVGRYRLWAAGDVPRTRFAVCRSVAHRLADPAVVWLAGGGCVPRNNRGGGHGPGLPSRRGDGVHRLNAWDSDGSGGSCRLERADGLGPRRHVAGRWPRGGGSSSAATLGGRRTTKFGGRTEVLDGLRIPCDRHRRRSRRNERAEGV